MQKLVLTLLVAFFLMSFTSTEKSDLGIETTLTTSIEYSFDLCLERVCVENPDGSTTCGPWMEIDCEDSPIGPIGGSNKR